MLQTSRALKKTHPNSPKHFATENKLAEPGRLCCPLGLSDTVQTRENLGVSCSWFLCLTQVLTQILFFPWRVWFDANFVVPAQVH